MEHEFVKVLGTDGPLVEIGPTDPLGDYVLSVPDRFRRRYQGTDGSQIELELVLEGDRLEVAELSVKFVGSFVTSRKLMRLALPSVVQKCSYTAIPSSAFWTVELPQRTGLGASLRENHMLLAKLYWFHHITWGSPRVVIQEMLGSQRTTANYFIRKASDSFELPASRHR